MLEDWGQRCPRWAGVRSEVLDVCGTSVHALRADGPDDRTPLLLVHGLGGSATNWLEVLPGLSAYGAVLAPDLPGFGRTEPPRSRASRIGGNARFLRALLATVGWDRVILVGNSMGGTIALLLAKLVPDRIDRLVLVAPALPAALRDLPRLPRQTMLRFAPFLVPGLGRAVLRRMWARMTPEELWADGAAFVHGDPSRVSPEQREVGVENLRYGREAGWRLPEFVAAAESLIGSVVIGRRLRATVDDVEAPTLLLWGTEDRLIGRPVIEALTARRPDWDLHVIEGAGHVAAIEVPDEVVAAIGGWFDATGGAPDAELNVSA